MQHYTTTDVEFAMAAFEAAYIQTRGRFLEPTAKQKVDGFAGEISARYLPYQLLTPHGLDNMIRTVFQDATYQEFIRVLQFQFFARWPCSDEMLESFCSTIARGVSADTSFDKAPVAMPSVYLEQLPIHSDATSLLRSNIWLLMVLLLIAYSTLGDLPQPRN